MHSFLYVIKQAYISLKQKPSFVLSVVSTMGITLGALLCVLTLGYVIFFKPLPYPEQDKLFQLNQYASSNESPISGFDYPTTVALYKKLQAFSSIAMSYHSDEVIQSHPKQLLVKTNFVTPQWFSLLSVPFLKGRALNENEDVNTHLPIAILSYNTWKNDFNADNDILNKTIIINSVSYKIIGVAGADFVDPQLNKSGFDTQIWLPWDFNPISYKHDWWGSYTNSLIIFGQKLETLTVKQVEQNTYNLICQILAPAIAQDFADPCTTLRIEAKTIKQAIIGDSNTVIYSLLIGAIGLIVIATTNMINLFVARTTELQHQFAINAALGAKRRHLVLALFIQVSLLMLAASALALLVTSSGFYLLSQYVNEFLPLVSQLRIHSVTIISLTLLVVIITFIIAKIGVSVLNYQSINSSLQSGSKGLSAQVPTKVRNGLIICQVAIASMLTFSGVNLSLNSIEKLTNSLGYQRDDISYLSLTIAQANNEQVSSVEQQLSLITLLKIKLLSLPEISGVSTAESPIGSFMRLSIKDIDTENYYLVETSFTDENYFELIGQPLIAGDNFVKQTTSNRIKALIINEVFAEKIGGNDNAIGKKLDFSNDGSNIYTVVGIVAGILAPGEKEVPIRMYAPASNLAPKFLIKFKNNQTLPREQIISSLQEVSSLFVISHYKSLDESFNNRLQLERITLVGTITTTIFSLVLAAIGMYGILSYSTQMRRFEIGTRMAIGAKRSDIIHLIIKENANALMLGIALCLLGLITLSYVFSEQLESYLNWHLLPLLLMTIALICIISFIACYLPLRQYINKPAQHSLRGAE